MIDADLGGGLIKQRVARAGQGRSGGYRTIVAYCAKRRAVFLYGFAKNERDNIEPDELLTFRSIAADLLAADAARIAEAIEDGQFYRRLTMTKKKTPSRLTEALLETADDLHRIGIMDDATYRQDHHSPPWRAGSENGQSRSPAMKSAPFASNANLSQAAFAHFLNLTAGYVSQLERGTKQPKGPALILLNVIRRKGLEVIL